jgi:ketol-acid reductoisomerase
LIAQIINRVKLADLVSVLLSDVSHFYPHRLIAKLSGATFTFTYSYNVHFHSYIY